MEVMDPTERAMANEILKVVSRFGRRDLGQLLEDLTSANRLAAVGDQTQGHNDGDLLSLVRALNEVHISGGQELSEQRAPLSLLRAVVELFFKFGPDPAFLLFSVLDLAVKIKSYEITAPSDVVIDVHDPGFIVDSTLWKSCKMAASLVLLLAARATPESLEKALKPQSMSMGGMPTYESLRSSAPDSLSGTFQEAKRAALGQGTTTVVGIRLVDKHIFELVARGTADQYFSFAHVFTMGVGPEGVVIWQAFGEHGYRLDEYIRDGHAGVRPWDQARDFVDSFEKLISLKGIWSAKINKLYKKLFLVDINEICSARGPERPVTPRFSPHVSLHYIKDVKCEDVAKFVWATTRP